MDEDGNVVRVLFVSPDYTELEAGRKQQRLLNGEVCHVFPQQPAFSKYHPNRDALIRLLSVKPAVRLGLHGWRLVRDSVHPPVAPRTVDQT